ncbi:uncharacterized protein V1513DRAFT_447340 [Lipomyces chichibuensis]|uniref:uncharacterized protein n=1 Tax=Lipomyces chichibuensis TaxID=1546026 RepID=UPI0033433A7A
MDTPDAIRQFTTPIRSTPHHSPSGRSVSTSALRSPNSPISRLLAYRTGKINGVQPSALPPPQPQVTTTTTTIAERSSDGLAEFLYTRGFLQGACSDVTIRAFGHDYALHRLILDRSPFFSMLFSGPWRDALCETLELSITDDPNMTQEAFELAIARLYGHCDPVAETKHAMSLLAVASFLDMQDLIASCVGHIVRSLTAKNLSEVLRFALNNNYGAASTRLVNSCKNILYCDGWEWGVEGWDAIPTAIAAEIVSGNPFFVATEWDRCMFVVDLINWHLTHHEQRGDSPVLDSTKGSKSSIIETSSEIDESVKTSEIKPDVVIDKGVHDQQNDKFKSIYDLQPLQQAMEGGIHYVHFTFEQIQELDAMRDVAGERVVRAETLREAVWANLSLRQKILTCPLDNTTLGLVNKGPLPPPDVAGRRTSYIIPSNDETTLEVGTSSVLLHSGPMRREGPVSGSPEDGEEEEELSWTRFPPYRFSLEFKHVSKLREEKRVYSGTIWYAGSYWNIYIQKVKQRKSVVQMGVYLHRVKDAHVQRASGTSVTVSDVDRASRSRSVSQENDQIEFTMETDVDHEGWGIPRSHSVTLDDVHITVSEAPEMLGRGNAAVAPTPTGTGVSYLFTPSSADVTQTNNTLPEYIDDRPMISTYFEIFTPSRKGKHAITCFSSSPDLFSFSKSWGWKSTTLCAPLDEQQQMAADDEANDINLKFMIVLGMSL